MHLLGAGSCGKNKTPWATAQERRQPMLFPLRLAAGGCHERVIGLNATPELRRKKDFCAVCGLSLTSSDKLEEPSEPCLIVPDSLLFSAIGIPQNPIPESVSRAATSQLA